MRLYIMTLMLVSCTMLSYSQDKFKELKKNKDFKPVLNVTTLQGMECYVGPQYINGKEGLDNYLAKQIEKQKIKEKGVVVLMYTINKEGKVSSIQADSKTPENLNKIVINALKESGPWIPATKEGKYTTMKMSISYEFK